VLMARAAAGRRYGGGRPARAARFGAEVSPLYDPGLQPERTRLAWRRTLLMLAVGTLVALRFLPGTVGVWSLGVGLLTSAVLWWLATLRGRQMHIALVVAPGPLPGGALL